MARRSPVKVGLALALICVITSHGQADETCRSGCRGAPQTFRLHEGTTYKYNFDSKIEVSLSSAEGQKSVTEVKATVLLTQQPQCNQILRLQNVQIISGDGKKHGHLPDIDKPIRLNYHDGHLEDSICITPGDTQNSLNIKRAIASIFQTNLKSGHETDVFGRCPTEVTHHKEGNVLVVQKTRNLNRCAYRESIRQDFFSTTYNLDSEIKSSPLLNADYSAKLRIKNGILELANVHEHYLYVPFSVGNNGAKASVETTLKYVGTAKDNAQVKVSQPRSVIFEDPHPVAAPTANVNSILAAVKQTAKTIDVTVSDATAKEFTNLVKIFRVSKKDDLLAVYNQVKAGVGFSDKAAAKKLFLDALLRAGNGDNVEVAIILLKNKELSPIEQNLVYLALSVVGHPTEGSLNSAISLLDQPNLPREAYLGIGNLAGRYCRQHSCQKVDALNKLIQKLAQKLTKATNRQQENDVVFALKALANIHHLSDAVLAKIIAIAQDKKGPNRLRAAALETYLAEPCKDKLRDSALNILKDIQQDSEIRIKAYLAVAACPNTKVSNAIKALLEHEPSYQVGGFIVSHIRNLRSSANPEKEQAKQHLGLINVPNRFPVDPRKYSSNGEFSYTIDTLGMANSIETNVIYSQNSFLPRSTSLNLNAEVFGHNFNFLELETRQENLDRLLEHYLGPKGLLRSQSLQELWETKGEYAKKLVHQLREKIDQSLRSRRDVSKSELDHIAKQVQVKTNNLNNDLDLDLGVKAFGSEILFVNVNDDVRKWTPEAIIDKIVSGLNTGLDKLKHFEETLRSNLLFLDAELSYPTSAGFPLRLGVEGAANLQVKASGDIDIRALVRGDTTLKISLIPSANIQVSGRLTVDALVVESGLKVVSTLHTATGGDLIVDLKRDKLDAKFSLPVEKQDLISATHDIVFHNREWGSHEVNVPLKFAQNKDFSICLDQLSPFIGLAFCAEITGPNLQGEKVPILPFPLSGDAKVGVSIEREDLSNYHYKEVYHNSPNQFGLEYVLEALAKNGQKKASLELSLFLAPEKFIRASLTSPVTSVSLEGRITTNDNEKSVSVRFVQDKDEYFGKVGVGIQGSPSKSVYKPIFQYKTPKNSALQISPYRVEGQIIVESKPGGKTYTLDNVRLIIPDQRTISVNGKLEDQGHQYFVDLTVADGRSSVSFNGKLELPPGGIKYNGELKNSLNPDANIRWKGEFSKSGDTIKNYFQLAHGGDFSNKNNILTLEDSLTYRNRGPHDYLIEIKNLFSYPLVGAVFKFGFELRPQVFVYGLDVQYGDVKFGSKLDWEHKQKREGVDFQLVFGIWGLNNHLDLKSKRQITGEQSQIQNSLDVNGKRIEVNGKVRHHIKPQDVDVGADLVVKVPTHNAPFQVVSGLKVNPNDIDVSHKVTSGNTVYIDLFFKANRVGNANGSIKVNLDGQLVVTGQVKTNKGNGNGDIVIELPKAGRSAKIDSTFTIHDPTYNVVVNIYPVFNQDKSKKIIISTHTTINRQNIDSKNFIDFFGNKLEGNVKGNMQGDIENGKINGEVDLTLPNHQYFVAKVNRDLRKVNNVFDGNGLLTAEHRQNKNQPGDKFTLKGQMKNTNFKESIFDLNYQISAERVHGKNLNLDLVLKRVPHGDGYNVEAGYKIYGALLGQPWESKLAGNYKNLAGDFNIRSSYQPLGSVAVSTKYDVTGSGRPVTGEASIELTSSSKTLKTLKTGVSGSVLKGDAIDVKGQANIYADAPDGVIVDLNGNGEVKASDKEGRVRGTIKSGKLDPITVDTGFTRKEGKNQELHGDVSVQYGKNQNVKGDIILIRLPHHEYKLEVKLDTPNEKFRNNRLLVHTKRNEDNSHHESEIIATTNGKTWTVNSDFVLSEVTPGVNIQVKDPEGKLRQLLAKVTKSSDSQLGAQLKIVNQQSNFLLEGTIDASVESIENFHIKVTANSPSLKIDKLVAEAQNKPGKGGRRIQITAKSGNKNILAGSTSYTAREDHGKLIIEGSGSFKVHDQTKSANFKYIRQNLSQNKNGEIGIEISFDAGLGNQAIDAELKFTNKQFRILNSYCEEKKQCAHVEIDVKTITDEISEFNQEIEIAVDLRKLGLSHEFGLKAVTIRKEYVLDHTVDIHFQSQANSKYQYSLYLHPREAGVSLTTPKRIIALEGKINVPQTLLKDGGRISGEVLLYTDKKNQPNKKSGLTSHLDVDIKARRVEGEIRFTNPALRRPLLVSFNSKVEVSGAKSNMDVVVVVDIFAQPDQKVTISYIQHYPGYDVNYQQQYDYLEALEVKSPGLLIDVKVQEYGQFRIGQNTYKGGAEVKYHVGNSRYDSALTYDCSPRNVQVLLKVLNVDLYKLNSQLQLTRDNQVANAEISYYGHKPLIVHAELKNLNTFKYTIARKDSPNNKLQINAGVIPGQIADFRAEVIQGGTSIELGHVTIKLDDANFLKSDYNVNSKNIEEHFLVPIRQSINKEASEMKHLSEEWTKNAQNEVRQLGDLFAKATPNLTPLRQYYVNELSKIKEEILADKTIKDVSEFLYNIFVAFSQAFGETLSHFSELVENIVKSFQNSFGKVIEAIEKELIPKFKELVDKLLNLSTEIINTVTEVVLIVISKLTEIAEHYRPELQQLTTVLGEVTQDVFRAAIRVVEAIRDVIVVQWQQVYDEIRHLPAFEQLRVEYEKFAKHGLPEPEVIAGTLKDITSTIKDIAPTEQLKELIQAIGDYITLKLTSKQPVDDTAAIKRIVKAAVAAADNIVDVLTGQETAPDLKNFKLPVPATLINKLPKWAAVKFSPIAYLLREDVPELDDLLLSLVNKPRNWVPPFPLYGLVAQGQHIFTFDGKHLTFPGKCNYLLARDAVDGNFSIVGSYSNGLLTAITLNQGSDTITLKKHGQVLVNNAQAELPTRKPNIAAYRNTERITLVTSYGARVICGPQLLVCSVTLSGFYHGKIRGLLGNGNNEPYDDFTLPNGKIVTSESDFGNGYKTTSSCAAVQTVSHQAHHATPACEKLFGWESSFRFCYPFVNVNNFKMACEHGLAAGVKDTEAAIAVAYVAACNQHNIPARLPSEFVKCSNGDKATALGDKFTVKTPGKQADIVLLVDTNKDNEQVYKEYVQPLVQQLTNELHSKGVSDIEFHIIAYGGDNQWPSHITTSGGKLTFKGKSPNLKFSENPKQERLSTGCRSLDSLIELIQDLGHDLELALGQTLQAQTYNEGLEYPFRANAIKSIIAVTGQPCEVGRFYPLQLLRTLLYRSKNINLNLITPISRAGAKAEAKNIVGFNGRNVFSLPGKTKIKSFFDLSKELDYDDYCIDFTVQNDGNVFVSDHIIAQSKNARKQFIQVTSHNIVDQFVGAEKTYDCECKYVTPFTASNVCKLVSIKEKTQPKKAGTKN